MLDGRGRLPRGRGLCVGAVGFVARGVGQFDLKGSVLDVAVEQFVLYAMFKFRDEFHGAGFVDDKMGGEGIFGCADGPDVDMMNFFDIFHAGDSIFDLADLDAGGDAVEGEAQAIA
jgi:hypothetical protein